MSFVHRPKGVTLIETITILIVLGVLLSLLYYKSAGGLNPEVRARAAHNHLKLMGERIENQKRHLGDYPLTLLAMVQKSRYLGPGGNRADYTTESELRGAWTGPYLTQHAPYQDPNYLPDIIYKINLDNIFPGLEGQLGYLFEAPQILAYVITVENAADALDGFNAVARAAIKKCNQTATVEIPPRSRLLSHSYVVPSAIQPCGYAALGDKIEYISYFIKHYQ